MFEILYNNKNSSTNLLKRSTTTKKPITGKAH
jgi:hypothetical protein